jgi:hypothetical protein
MIKLIRKSYYAAGAAFVVSILASSDAHAAANTFSTIAQNITSSVSSIPGLITAVAYLLGILLVVLGIMKIKDHVENPGNTPIKDGAIRLLIGGALFALPIVLESGLEAIGSGGTATKAATLYKVQFNVT